MTIIYTALAIILDDKGRPIRAGDQVVITLSDTTTVIGTMQNPFNPDDLKYTFLLPEGVEIDICQIESIAFFSCCDALELEIERLDDLIEAQDVLITNLTNALANANANILLNTNAIASINLAIAELQAP